MISDETLFWMEVLKPNRKRRVTVLFPADVPACGYTTVYAQPNVSIPATAPQNDLKSLPCTAAKTAS